MGTLSASRLVRAVPFLVQPPLCRKSLFEGARLGIGPGLALHGMQSCRVTRQLHHGFGIGRRVFLADYKTGTAFQNIFPRAAMAADNDGQARSLRLKHHVAEGIRDGGKNENIRLLIGGNQSITVQTTGKMYRQLGGLEPQFVQDRTISDQRQPGFRQCCRDTGKGVDK